MIICPPRSHLHDRDVRGVHAGYAHGPRPEGAHVGDQRELLAQLVVGRVQPGARPHAQHPFIERLPGRLRVRAHVQGEL